jgi:hypothetical protein
MSLLNAKDIALQECAAHPLDHARKSLLENAFAGTLAL